jgi:hypothetical protein
MKLVNTGHTKSCSYGSVRQIICFRSFSCTDYLCDVVFVTLSTERKERPPQWTPSRLNPKYHLHTRMSSNMRVRYISLAGLYWLEITIDYSDEG